MKNLVISGTRIHKLSAEFFRRDFQGQTQFRVEFVEPLVGGYSPSSVQPTQARNGRSLQASSVENGFSNSITLFFFADTPPRPPILT